MSSRSGLQPVTDHDVKLVPVLCPHLKFEVLGLCSLKVSTYAAGLNFGTFVMFLYVDDLEVCWVFG